MEPVIKLHWIAIVLLSSIPSNQANCTTLEFLLLGATPGSTTESVVAFNDEHSGPVAIPGGLPYSNGNTTSTFVSENGAISFGTAVSAPPSTPGTSLQPDAGNSFLLAPFWTDYDLGAGGNVRYEVYEHQEPEETQRLELVSEYVVNCTDGLEVFNATWMLLAEWSDCQPRGNTNPGNLNTFQALVLTDNTNNSFAIFIYRCDMIQWSGSDPNFAKIGVNFGGGMEFIHNLSGIEEARNIDCLSSGMGSEFVNVLYDLNVPQAVVSSTATSMILPETTQQSISVTLTSIESSSASSFASAQSRTISTMDQTTVSSPPQATPTRSVDITSSFIIDATTTPDPTQESSLSLPLLTITILLPLLAVTMLIVVLVSILVCIMLSKGKKNKVNVHAGDGLPSGQKAQPPPSTLSMFSADQGQPPHAVNQSQLNTSTAPLIETELQSPVSVHPQSFS